FTHIQADRLQSHPPHLCLLHQISQTGQLPFQKFSLSINTALFLVFSKIISKKCRLMVSISCKRNPSKRKRKGKILKKLLPTFYFSSRSSCFLQKM
ncbi:hypothetical protein N336_09362, partial [Phalacrocorax carbo]